MFTGLARTSIARSALARSFSSDSISLHKRCRSASYLANVGQVTINRSKASCVVIELVGRCEGSDGAEGLHDKSQGSKFTLPRVEVPVRSPEFMGLINPQEESKDRAEQRWERWERKSVQGV